MNFIAHYYLDRNITHPCFVVGTSTPDLVSIFDRNHRVKATHIRRSMGEITGDPWRMNFRQGINRHVKADRLFHSADFFKYETLHLSRMVSERFASDTPRRTYFVGHIVFELILDKILIERDPSLVADFYRIMESEPVTRYQELTEWILDEPLPGYDQFLQRFIDRRYLLHYPNIDHLTYTLRRIMLRVGLTDTTYMQTTAFADLLHTYQAELTPRVDPIIDEIRHNM